MRSERMKSNAKHLLLYESDVCSKMNQNIIVEPLSNRFGKKALKKREN